MAVLNDEIRNSVKEYIIETYKRIIENMYRMQPEDVLKETIDLAEYVTILDLKQFKECYLWQRKFDLALMKQRSLNSNYDRCFMAENKKKNPYVSEEDLKLYQDYVRSFEFEIKSKELLKRIENNDESAKVLLQKLYEELRVYYKNMPFSKIDVKTKDLLHKPLLDIMGSTLKFHVEPCLDINTVDEMNLRGAKNVLNDKNSTFEDKIKAKKVKEKIDAKQRAVYPNEKPYLFACNHTNVHDVPVICKVIKEHVYIVAGDEVINDVNGLLFKLNGVDFVSRHIPESRFKAKEMAVRRLINGLNYKVLPEGTWNRTENKPMLYFNWGIIEIAQKSGVPIIPVVIEYTKDTCYYKIGEPINVSIYDDKKEAINKLRDTMASMRWEIWERLPHEKRENVSKEQFYDEVVDASLREYPKLDPSYEDSIRYMPYDEPEDVYKHLDQLKLTRNNAFLLNKNNK